jgi:phosphoglycolate phosphatase-like HAD superfamily hydrolase
MSASDGGECSKPTESTERVAQSRPPIKALVLDFDSTISTPTFLHRVNAWAIADSVDIFSGMSEQEIVANFGGSKRIKSLEELLSALQAAGVCLHVISIGFKASYVPHLQKIGLLRFFAEEQLFGQDSPELRRVGFVKGRLIAQIMAARGWCADEVLFVDDSKEHIERAADVCRTLLVTSKATVGGMSESEFEAIRAYAGLDCAS